jgi:hypothetical protein
VKQSVNNLDNHEADEWKIVGQKIPQVKSKNQITENDDQ